MPKHSLMQGELGAWTWKNKTLENTNWCMSK